MQQARAAVAGAAWLVALAPLTGSFNDDAAATGSASRMIARCMREVTGGSGRRTKRNETKRHGRRFHGHSVMDRSAGCPHTADAACILIQRPTYHTHVKAKSSLGFCCGSVQVAAVVGCQLSGGCMSCDSLVALYLNVLPPSKIKWTFRVQNFSHIKRSRRPGASTDARMGSWRTHFTIFLFMSCWKRPKSYWKFL